MLNIYLYSTDYVKDNNDYFKHFTYGLVSDSAKQIDIAGIIKDIDNGDFNSRFLTVSNMFGNAEPLTSLSLGCKTLLNIYLNPDKIFYGQEMGENALDLLLLLNGSVYFKWLPFIPDIYEVPGCTFHISPTITELLPYIEGWRKYASN